jgi:hypothetical protein
MPSFAFDPIIFGKLIFLTFCTDLQTKNEEHTVSFSIYG